MGETPLRVVAFLGELPLCCTVRNGDNWDVFRLALRLPELAAPIALLLELLTVFQARLDEFEVPAAFTVVNRLLTAYFRSERGSFASSLLISVDLG